MSSLCIYYIPQEVALYCNTITRNGGNTEAKQAKSYRNTALAFAVVNTHSKPNMLISNIICYSKDLPSHFRQLYKAEEGESAFFFQDI